MVNDFIRCIYMYCIVFWLCNSVFDFSSFFFSLFFYPLYIPTFDTFITELQCSLVFYSHTQIFSSFNCHIFSCCDLFLLCSCYFLLFQFSKIMLPQFSYHSFIQSSSILLFIACSNPKP